ncbi:MAG: redoxin domain-containing protein [Chitinophagaceae bacterium]|nr:redoxin domain-containing protein [Chitinophagaceae bacterium]
MRKTILLTVLVVSVSALFAQQDSIQPPYKKFPVYPPAKLLLPDNTSYYTKDDLPKKKPVMLMLFSPQCEHCQHETEVMTANMDKFDNVHIVMATTAPMPELLAFREKYKLTQFDNIVLCRDQDFFLFTFFALHNFPFHAFYNKKKELISAFEGSMTLEKVLSQFGK